MTIDQLASAILQLAPHERTILAETIWESLEGLFVFSSDISEEKAIELAKRRDEEIERGNVIALTHKELMAKLQK